MSKEFGPRFPNAEDGIAAVEFALVLPFMLLLLFGMVEITHAFQIKQRIALAEYVLGDLIGRSEELSSDQIDDVFDAVDLLMAPYTTENFTVAIRAIEIDSNGNANVLWGRRSDGETASNTAPEELDSNLGTDRELIEITTQYIFEMNMVIADDLTVEFGQTAYLIPRAADLSSWNGN